MTLRTWHLEMAIVAVILATTAALSGHTLAEWVGAAAVLAGFGHAAVAERLREREAERPIRSVECYRHLEGYFYAREVLWTAYFVLLGARSALVGCVVFALYPLWRRWWRKRYPINRGTDAAQGPPQTPTPAPSRLTRAEREELAQQLADAFLGGQHSRETAEEHRARAEGYRAALDAQGLLLAERLIAERWYRRDLYRTAAGLEPDGLWNAALICGTTIAGIEKLERLSTLVRHCKTCPECYLEHHDEVAECLRDR